MVNRRSAIRHLFCISAGALIIPSCMQDKSKSSILLKNLEIDGDQEKLIEELSETIIPRTSTPGARDIYAHLFVLKMVDDCFKKDDQKKFSKGLRAFQSMAKKELDSTFVTSTGEKRQSLLTKLEAQKESDEPINYFYSTTKRLTIHAYTSSEFYLTKVQVYEMVPGRFNGCIPVKASKESLPNKI